MAERLTLDDLCLKSGVVKYGAREIEYHALTPRDLLHVMRSYDEFKKFLVHVSISIEEAMKSCPGIFAAIIVSGTRTARGNLSREEAEAKALDIPAELQVNLVLAIWNASFTSGFGPFLEKVRMIAGVAQIGAGRGRGIRSEPSSHGTGASSASPSATRGNSAPVNSQPTPSSTAETTSPRPGTTST